MGDLFSVKNKVIIVTGASRGIGKAIAKHLADQEAIVYATGTHPSSVEWMKNENNITGKTLDISQVSSVTSLFEEIYSNHSKVDAVINNAGIFEYCPISRITEEEMDRTINVNLKGLFRMCQTYFKKQKKGGNIVNIASIMGIVVEKLAGIYAATKAGNIQLTKAFALEWAHLDFRVNAIAPGYISTDMNEKARNHPTTAQSILDVIPVKRFGEPEDICGTTQFLVSNASSYITGQTIVVDGGIIIR